MTTGGEMKPRGMTPAGEESGWRTDTLSNQCFNPSNFSTGDTTVGSCNQALCFAQQLCAWKPQRWCSWVAMLEERFPSTALVAGTQTTALKISTCTSAKRSAPEKTWSFRLRGRAWRSRGGGDTVWRSAGQMEPSRWPLRGWRRWTRGHITVDRGKVSLCCTRRSISLSSIMVCLW